MNNDLYKNLARHIDSLPGGFPETDSGVELKILKLLFTEEEAKLTLHLSLISEDAATIALRAGIPVKAASLKLEEMAAKGLIFRSKKEGMSPQYMAAQFVVGIWELQVDRLTPELTSYMNEYIPHLLNVDTWKKAPQMRVIPVGKSIDNALDIMTYERAEALIKDKENFVVAPCICRREKQMENEGCKKPMDTCISFGDEEEFYLKNGAGRKTTRDEVIEILKKADKAGLVLQPSNGKDLSWLCCCCGCCCGVLRTINDYPNPAEIVATPFIAAYDESKCNGCGVCVKRCQMSAFKVESKNIDYNLKRCIGCGLCVSTCAPGALKLVRKPSAMQSPVPRDIVYASLKLLWKRGKNGPLGLTKMAGKSVLDRLRSRKIRKNIQLK